MIITHYYKPIITFLNEIIITHYYNIIPLLLSHYYIIIMSLLHMGNQAITEPLLHIICNEYMSNITQLLPIITSLLQMGSLLPIAD